MGILGISNRSQFNFLIAILYFTIKASEETNLISYENYHDRDHIMEKLAKSLRSLYDEISKLSRVKIITTELDDDFKEIRLKNGERFFAKDKVALVNAANSKFTPKFNFFSLNSAISRFLLDNNGINRKKSWKKLKSINNSIYSKRIKISNFKYGIIIHIHGIKAKELENLKLSLEEFESYMFNLYLKAFKEIERRIPNGNVMLFFISTRNYAIDAIDNLQVNFTSKEFIQRAKLACYKAIKRYKGDLNIILNAYY